MFDYLAHSHPSPELVNDVQDLFLLIISIQRKKKKRGENARQKERNEKEQRKILEPQQ